MKKKIMSVIVMVAVLVTMLSTTVFAGSGDTSAREVRQTMQKTADWYAGKIYENLEDGPSALIVQEGAYPVFLAAKTGSTSENVTNLENLFLNALKDDIEESGKVVGTYGSESIDVYSNAILALLAMGKDPANFEGYNIVKLLSDACASGSVSILMPEKAYNVVSAAAVSAYYKSFSNDINNQYIQISKETIYNYVKTAVVDSKEVMSYDATTYGVDLNAEGITVDANDYVHVTDEALAALNQSSQYTFTNL
ncbi:MAG: hypothetical protein E7242_07290 [Lachnospiraceae bacterium]|nr:hypothetical protein [Lachnospiraceae bacterium]